MENIKIYDFDPLGTAPENKVNEQHPIGEYGVFIMKTGAFFKDSAVFTMAGRTLTPSIDFKFILPDNKASLATGQSCYTGIVLIKDAVGSVLDVEVQTVGGPYASYQEQIIRAIEELGLLSRIIHLSDLVGVPETFPPGPHKTLGSNLIGLGRLVEILAEVRDSITEGNPDSVAAAMAIAKDAVVSYGQINPKPKNGACTLDVTGNTETQQDFLIPRSESQDNYVQIEFSFVGPLGSGNGCISYLETVDGVNNVKGWFTADGTVTKLVVGLDVTNSNRTLLRLFNEADSKPWGGFFLKSINTTDTQKFARYNEITQLETPSGVTLAKINLTAK